LSGTNQSIATPTTIGVWSPTRGGVETNYISGTALDDLRTDLATSFPNGNFLGSDARTNSLEKLMSSRSMRSQMLKLQFK
jgi:hypothetical protein